LFMISKIAPSFIRLPSTSSQPTCAFSLQASSFLYSLLLFHR
jgi:hypothetical protein